jgi:hypothetical protein
MNFTLPGWHQFFQREIQALESSGFEYRIEVADGDFPDRLVEEATAVCPALDRAVAYFCANGSIWPMLSDAEKFFLLMRLNLISTFIALFIADGPYTQYNHLPEPPDLDDEPAFLRWSLIEVWSTAGEDYLRGTAEGFFNRVADDPRPVIVVRCPTVKSQGDRV